MDKTSTLKNLGSKIALLDMGGKAFEKYNFLYLCIFNLLRIFKEINV